MRGQYKKKRRGSAERRREYNMEDKINRCKYARIRELHIIEGDEKEMRRGEKRR